MSYVTLCKRSYFCKTGNVTYDFLEKKLTPLQGPRIQIYPMRTKVVCWMRTYGFVNDIVDFKLGLDIYKLEDPEDAIVAISQHMSVWIEQNHEEFRSTRFPGRDSIQTPPPHKRYKARMLTTVQLRSVYVRYMYTYALTDPMSTVG